MSDVGGQWADRAYIGSFTSAGGRGITTASIDAESGALTELHHTDNDVADPSYLTLTEGPGGRYRPGGHLYAVSERDVGGAAAFSLDDRDRPVLIGRPPPVRGGAPTHLTIAAGHLLTANYGSGSVSALPATRRRHPREPRLACCSTPATGPSRPGRRDRTPTQVLPDPARPLGAQRRPRHRLRPGVRPADACPDGELLTADGDRAAPRHRARATSPSTPTGAHAYVLNELDTDRHRLPLGRRTGTLEPLGETRPCRRTPHRSATTPRSLSSRPTAASVGRQPRATTASRSSPSTPTASAWSWPARCPAAATGPATSPCDPSGRWLYAANERSGDVTWFDVDPVTGTPHRAGARQRPGRSA